MSSSRNFTDKPAASMTAIGCGFNRSMQHLFSKHREGDVDNEAKNDIQYMQISGNMAFMLPIHATEHFFEFLVTHDQVYPSVCFPVSYCTTDQRVHEEVTGVEWFLFH
jgi:hypothetical protein